MNFCRFLKTYRAAAAGVLFAALTLIASAQPGPGGPPLDGHDRPGFGPGTGPGGALLRQGFRKHFGPELAMRFGTRWLTTPEAIKQLKLSDEQVNKLKQIDVDVERKRIDHHAEIQKAHLDLRQAMEQDNPDRDKVLGLIERVGKLQTEMKKDGASQLLNAREVLTPEQRKQAKEHMEQHRPGRGMMRHFGQHFRGGPGGFGRGPHGRGQQPQGSPPAGGPGTHGGPGVSFNEPFQGGPEGPEFAEGAQLYDQAIGPEQMEEAGEFLEALGTEI